MRSSGNAQVGEYAEGVGIAALDGGLRNLVTPTSDSLDSNFPATDFSCAAPPATYTDYRLSNTKTKYADCCVVNQEYAWGYCSLLIVDGGYTQDWFVPAS